MPIATETAIAGTVLLPSCCDAGAVELDDVGWLLLKPAKASMFVKELLASLAAGCGVLFGEGGDTPMVGA